MSDEIQKEGAVECPHCGYKIDAHQSTDAPEDKPQPDDISICFSCAGVNKYTQGMTLVKFTEEDRHRTDPQLLLEVDMLCDKIRKHNKTQKKIGKDINPLDN